MKRLFSVVLSVLITSHLGSALDSSTPLANLSLKVYKPDGSLAGQSNLTYANFENVQIYTPVSGQYSVVIDGESADKEYIGFAIWN